MIKKKNKCDKLWGISIFFTIPCAAVFGFVFATIVLGKESYECQQTLNDPKHCADICADQLLRFENKGLITIHCQKCSTKGGKDE